MTIRKPDSPAVHLRRATVHDRAFVTSLAARFAETRPLWRSEHEVADGTRRQLEDAFATLDDQSQALFIAERARGNGADEPIGFVWVVVHTDFFTGEPHAHVSEIAVSVEAAGVGSALMAEAEAWARARGDRYLSLNVNERNVRARALYERLGYDTDHIALVKRLL